MNDATPPAKCRGDFRHAKNTLQLCGFEESDWSDVFHVLMAQGAFCDCEILYNADVESRLKTHYWQSRAHDTRSEKRPAGLLGVATSNPVVPATPLSLSSRSTCDRGFLWGLRTNNHPP